MLRKHLGGLTKMEPFVFGVIQRMCGTLRRRADIETGKHIVDKEHQTLEMFFYNEAFRTVAARLF